MPSRGTRQDARGIGAIRAAYAAGATPLDVVEGVLHRVAGQAQPQAWITTVDADSLRARAHALAAVPPQSRSALWGIPFAVKDNLDVAGLPTTAACPAFAYTATRTATAVQRLLDAGAILVGKTNLDQLATGLTGMRSPYGTCTSTLVPQVISGGSSSGSAVVVADGLVPFALGSDTAGSGRVPAALNGIVGLKPARGLVSTTGLVPACRSLDCVSVLARDVGDATAVLDVLAAHDPADPWSRRTVLSPARPASAVRVGVVADDVLKAETDSDQRPAYVLARDRATALTRVRTVEVEPFLAAGDLLYGGPWVAERYAGLAAFLDAHLDSGALHPVTRAVLAGGRHVTGVEAFAGLHRLQVLRAAVDRLWDEVDALLVPTVGTTFTLAEVDADPVATNAALGRWTHPVNLLDLAAVAVPAGLTAAGRPAGVSVVGPAGSDRLLASLAAALNGGARAHRSTSLEHA